MRLARPKRRDLNTEVFVRINRWLEEERPADWVGFTHLGLRSRTGFPPRWTKPEVLLDVIVYRRGSFSRPIFGAETEWSRRRRVVRDTSSTLSLSQIGLHPGESTDQAMIDRMYDLLRLATVGPGTMAFLAREDFKADDVLSELYQFAGRLKNQGMISEEQDLLLAVLKRRDDGYCGFITERR